MIWVIIIIVLIFIVVIFNNFRIAKVNEMFIDDLFGNTMLSILLGALLSVVIQVELESPKAIDVYRGNTELKITYIDTIPQDTVVVWKGGKQ